MEALLVQASLKIGIDVDIFYVVISLGLSVLLGACFRIFCSIDKVSGQTRHWIQIIVGLNLGYFAYGQQIYHVPIQSFLCYLSMKVVQGPKMGIAVFITSIIYLTAYNYYRYTQLYLLDIRDMHAPLMMSTARLSSIGFAVCDGIYSKDKKLPPTITDVAISNHPSLLQFSSYMFNFLSILTGPFCHFKYYNDFIEGRYPLIPKSSLVQELVPIVLGATYTGLCKVFISPYFRLSYMLSDQFIKHSFIYKATYFVLASEIIMYKYIFAWFLSQGAHLVAGLAYNGVDKNGNTKWDLMRSIDMPTAYTTLSFREAVESWNICSVYWLKHLIKYRLPRRFLPPLVSILFCGFWHGFYLGYYISTGHVLLFHLTTSFTLRKLQPLFIKPNIVSVTFKCTTWLFVTYLTRIALIPGLLMDPNIALIILKSMHFAPYYMCIALISFAALL